MQSELRKPNRANQKRPREQPASAKEDEQHKSDILPVAEAKASIIKMISHNNAVIIVGETGSGKTTQIPQYVLDHVSNGKMVGCTQPRRVAAVSIARYVASQRKCNVGEEVGYSVRFDDNSSPKTRLKFMTDGILLREILADPKLEKYGAIILDEAHERTLHGDVLFGLLKALTRERQDLKIVVMSATLNAKHFSTFWRNAPIGVVHGRSFPVAISHTVEPQADYVDACINTILQIHTEEPPGDILCFLTGQEEIEDAKRVLEARQKMLPQNVPDYLVLTIYAAMPYEKQLLVFDKAPNGQRKIILATNIAETSITIEGIKYVVDSGMVKSKSYNSKTNMESLQEAPESSAQALQRSGRAGRMSSGKCFRIFTEDAFDNLAPETIPEIKRCSLNSVVLQMKAMGIDDLLSFEFLDMPPPEAIVKAQEMLVLLGALDAGTLKITNLGKQLSEFPIEPESARALLAGDQLGIADDVIIVVALLATENIFIQSKGNHETSDRCKIQFAKSVGDHVTLLHIYHAYERQAGHSKKQWCESNGINIRQMQRAEDIMTQLRDLLRQVRSRTGTPATIGFDQRNISEEKFADNDKLRQAFCCGYFLHTAYFEPKLQMYRTLIGNQPVHLHPSSVIFTMTKKKPQLVIFNSMVQTTRKYMKDVIVVRNEWLAEAAPQFFQAVPK